MTRHLGDTVSSVAGAGYGPLNGMECRVRSIAVTSGKGGVGKSSVVASLGYIFASAGLRVLVLDADMGLANIDVLLGLAPERTMRDFLEGGCRLREIVLEGPGGMKILPAGSGVLEMTALGKEQLMAILGELAALRDEYDLLLIDTAAGVSSNVLHFNTVAEEVVIVVTPDPTSLTDAYALIKLMAVNFRRRRFSVLVNCVENPEESVQVYDTLNLAVERFLGFSLTSLGSVPKDPKMAGSVREQRAMAELFPGAAATRSLMEVAARLRSMRRSPEASKELNLFGRYR